jgi:hypothetical protein
VFADTVQTDVVNELNETAKPELAVALTVNGALPSALSVSAAKEIVCGLFGDEGKPTTVRGVLASLLPPSPNCP